MPSPYLIEHDHLQLTPHFPTVLVARCCQLLQRHSGVAKRRCHRYVHIARVFLNAHDVAVFVGKGDVDLGITGEDIVAETNSIVTVEHKMNIGQCKLALPPSPWTATTTTQIITPSFQIPFKVFLKVIQQQQAIVRRKRTPLGPELNDFPTLFLLLIVVLCNHSFQN